MPKTSSNCFFIFFVILFIPALLFSAILVGYLNIIPFKVELHSVITIGLIFFIFIFFIRHNASFISCKIRSSLYDVEDELHKYLSKHTLTIEDETKSPVEIEAYLQKYFQNVRNDNFASVAAAVFPMLGILGTFISIAMSMPDFSVQDTEALDHEITILLSGVGTAFYASIYGIFLALWWIFFEKRGLSRIEQIFDSLIKLYDKYIWSKEELEGYKYTQNQMRDEKLIQSLRHTFNLDFIKDLNEQHLSSYKTVIDETSRSFGKITADMQDASSELTKTLEEINYSNSALKATIQIDDSLKKFADATFKLDSSVVSLSNSIEGNFEKIDNEIGNIVIKLADFATSVNEQSLQTSQSIKQYHKEIKDVQKTITKG